MHCVTEKNTRARSKCVTLPTKCVTVHTQSSTAPPITLQYKDINDVNAESDTDILCTRTSTLQAGDAPLSPARPRCPARSGAADAKVTSSFRPRRNHDFISVFGPCSQHAGLPFMYHSSTYSSRVPSLKWWIHLRREGPLTR